MCIFVFCDSDNGDMGSASTTNANSYCSPRWIVYPQSFSYNGSRIGKRTQRQCLDACVTNTTCITAQWNSNNTFCQLHYVRPSRRIHQFNSTQFDIVRQCSNTLGTWPFPGLLTIYFQNIIIITKI